MQTLYVSFEYESNIYTANVVKIPSTSGSRVQFHAINIEPVILGAPDVFIFSDSSQGFCWGEHPGCTGLGGAILKGITEYCRDNNIEMHS